MSSDTSNENCNEEAIKTVEAYEANKTPKIIRVLTVCAYLICVSLAAIMLSIYYIFLWEPKPNDPSTTHSSSGTSLGHGRKHWTVRMKQIRRRRYPSDSYPALRFLFNFSIVCHCHNSILFTINVHHYLSQHQNRQHQKMSNGFIRVW